MAIEGLAIVGPTASGKTAFAHAVVQRHRDLVPIAVDAMGIYDALPITTAMPTLAEIRQFDYRFVANVPVDEEYSLGQFLRELERELLGLARQGRRPLFVGGTALWVRAVVNGFVPPQGARGLRLWLETRLVEEVDDRSAYHLLSQLDARAAAGLDLRNRRRLIRALEVALASGGLESVAGDRLGTDIPPCFPQVGLRLAPEVHAERIRARVLDQIERGWVDEVSKVLRAHPSRTALAALGIAEIAAYLDDRSNLEEAIEQIIRRTRRLAKRQMSWLQRDPRIAWVSSIEEGVAVVESMFAKEEPSGNLSVDDW